MWESRTPPGSIASHAEIKILHGSSAGRLNINEGMYSGGKNRGARLTNAMASAKDGVDGFAGNDHVRSKALELAIPSQVLSVKA